MTKKTGSCCSGRRTFLKQVASGASLTSINLSPGAMAAGAAASLSGSSDTRPSYTDFTFPRVYRNEQLRTIGFPLGGIGTGCISVGGRGELRDWEIFNEPEKEYAPWYSFPTIWVKPDGEDSTTRVLEARIMPPHEYPSGHWYRIPGMPRLEDSVFQGEYPFARVDFEDRKFPVKVWLEAFNPLIPLDVEGSSLPLAVLRYHVRNPLRKRVKLSIAFTVNNPIGERYGQGGRVNEYRETAELKGLFMHNPSLEEAHPRNGSLALAAIGDSGEISYLETWRDHVWEMSLRTFWDDLSEDGRLGPASRYAPLVAEYVGMDQIETGSICISKELASEAETTITFLLGWHIPNRTPAVCGWDAPEGEENTVIGNLYCQRFSDAWEVVSHAGQHLPELEKVSREFVHSMKDTTLPAVVLDAALSNLSTLKTNTVFHTADGRFHGFEGCKDKGCCFGSCTHVWDYESMLPHLFPSLSRSFLDTWLGFCTEESGLMNFRYYLPFGKKRYSYAAADGQMGVLLRAYLDWRLTGDTVWLKGIWPKIRKALEFAWVKGGWDEDQDGVMEGCQHNTYDVQFFGPNPISGILYLGALRACEEMARAVGEDAVANQYRELFENGSKWIDSNLFNGEYYIQKIQGRPLSEIAQGLMVFETDRDLAGETAVVDTENPLNQLGDGSLADQLFGQELAHVAGLGYLLDPAKVHSALDSVHRYNFKRDLSETLIQLHAWALNDESAVLLCDYTAHPPPQQPFMVHTAVLTGLEYMIAAHMFFEGKYGQGLDLVAATRSRYDGARRNPWNEIECGYHYSRALASWSCILAICGFSYRRADARVTLSPRMPSNPSRGFWCVPTGWGGYSHNLAGNTATVEIWVRRGKLSCRMVELGSLQSDHFSSVQAEAGSHIVSADVAKCENGMMVNLEREIDILPGESFLLSLM